MTTSEPTPGDHDELLARLDRADDPASDGFVPGVGHLFAEAADALRTEQSARQAARKDQQYETEQKIKLAEQVTALQQRIDAALTLLGELIWNEEDLGAVAFVRAALTAPTVSTEYGRPFTCAELGHENCDGSHPDHHVEE